MKRQGMKIGKEVGEVKMFKYFSYVLHRKIDFRWSKKSRDSSEILCDERFLIRLKH